MKYTVFDLDINRLYGVYDTLGEATAYVQELLSANSDEYADDLAIIPRSDSGEYGDPVTGDALRALLREVALKRVPVAPSHR